MSTEPVTDTTATAPRTILPGGRLTVVETVYHEPMDDVPSVVDTRFTRPLSSNERAYDRRMQVGQEWVPLDTGWLGEVGMLIISNPDPPERVQPTESEREERASRVIELRSGGVQFGDLYQFYIPPGESMRFYPVEPRSIRMRCRSGTARVVVTAIPA